MRLPDFYSPLYRALIIAAREAADLAYCPYSRFPVGAALLTSEGIIYRGANVENGGFSQTMHAEEVALSAAFSDGVFKRADAKGVDRFHAIEALAIYVPNTPGAWPCGNCRQTLSEFFQGQVIITITGPGDDNFDVMRFSSLLPHQFPHEGVLASAQLRASPTHHP